MKAEYADFGMNYSKLGRRAAIYVDEVVSPDNYDAFIDVAQNYEQNITKVAVKSKKAAAAGVAAVVTCGLAGAVLPIVRKLRNKAKVKDQMYNCAVMKFYLEDLSRFLGLA